MGIKTGFQTSSLARRRFPAPRTIESPRASAGAGGRRAGTRVGVANSADPDVREVLTAPGNPGAAEVGRVLPVNLAIPIACSSSSSVSAST